MCKLNKGLFLANDQEATLRKSSPATATHRNSRFGRKLTRVFGWMEHFSCLGFLPGSSADMPQFRAFRALEHFMG